MTLKINEPYIIPEHTEFDPEVEAHCHLTRIIRDIPYHTHEFYEICLVTAGTVTHVVNGKHFNLKQGHIIFIRKNDKHGYINSSPDYKHINFSFSENSLEKFNAFIESGFNMTSLLESEYPPTVLLPKQDETNVLFRMSELIVSNNTPYNKQELKAKSRYLMAYIFIKYFSNIISADSKIPFWLKHTYDAMKLPKNFIEGHDRMVKISGHSPEHLSRSFKKYYNITPVNYIIELRLNHAATLLSTGTLSVTDVCYECGFNNLAWFYEIFTKQFGLSPGKYRKKFSHANM